MYILGISGLEHDPAAAIVGEQGIIAAIEETKLERSRAASGIPRAAIQYCLQRAGVRLDEVECLAVASRPLQAWARRAWLRGRRAPFAILPGGYYQAKAIGDLGRDLNNSRLLHLLDESPPAHIQNLEHHLCHAASAFYASPMDRALVLTLDQEGDGRAGLVAMGEGTRLRPLRSIQFPHSLGWVFSQVTDLIGFASSWR